MPGDGVSHRRRSWQDVHENLGPFSVADAVCTRGDFVCPADLCAKGCERRDDGSQTCGDAARTRTHPRHRGRLVFAERGGACKTSRRIQRLAARAASGKAKLETLKRNRNLEMLKPKSLSSKAKTQNLKTEN